MSQGPPQPHARGMSPFSAAPRLTTRMLGFEADERLDRDRRRAKDRRRARKRSVRG